MDFIRLQVSATIPADTRLSVACEAQINLRTTPCHNSGEGSGSEIDLYGSSSTLSSHYHSKNPLYLFAYHRLHIILANEALVRFYILDYIVGSLAMKLLHILISKCDLYT